MLTTGSLVLAILGAIIIASVLYSVLRNGPNYLDPYGEEFDDEIDDHYTPNPRNPTYDHSVVPLGETPVAPILTLNGLADEIGVINRNNGWRTFNTPERAWTENPYYVPAVLMLIVSEAAEALEAYRKDDRENFDEEVADILIRVLDLADLLDIDISSETLDKMDTNRTRGYRHGGKRV